MSGRRLRRRANIKSALVYRVVLAGISFPNVVIIQKLKLYKQTFFNLIKSRFVGRGSWVKGRGGRGGFRDTQLQLGCACELQLMATTHKLVLTGVAPDAERVGCYT